MFELHPGYKGRHTQGQAPGAIPNGTRVVKQNTQPGDSQPDGALGIVLGSFKAPTGLKLAARSERLMGVTYFYFVEWDALPGVAVGVVSTKITAWHADG
jgi:hypothetical protein